MERSKLLATLAASLLATALVCVTSHASATVDDDSSSSDLSYDAIVDQPRKKRQHSMRQRARNKNRRSEATRLIS